MLSKSWRISFLLVLVVYIMYSPGLLWAQGLCRLHINQTITYGHLSTLQKKGFKVVSHKKRDQRTFELGFQKGDFGFAIVNGMRKPEPQLYWRTLRNEYGHMVIAHHPRVVLPKSKLEHATHQNFAQLMPTCAELKKLQPDLHYGLLMRINSKTSHEFLTQLGKSRNSWGQFFINIEATMLNRNNFDRRNKFMTIANKRYEKIIAMKESIAQIPDFRTKMDFLRERLFKIYGMENYCADRVQILNFLMTKKPCGNCVSQTLLLMAAMKDMEVEIPAGHKLGVQLFKDHIRPVIIEEKPTRRILDLVYGKYDKRFDGTIYRPEFLMWMYERFLLEANSPYKHWYFPTLDFRRSLIIHQTIGRTLLDTFMGWNDDKSGHLIYREGVSYAKWTAGGAPATAKLSYSPISDEETTDFSFSARASGTASDSDGESGGIEVTEADSEAPGHIEAMEKDELAEFLDRSESSALRKAVTIQELQASLKLVEVSDAGLTAYAFRTHQCKDSGETLHDDALDIEADKRDIVFNDSRGAKIRLQILLVLFQKEHDCRQFETLDTYGKYLLLLKIVHQEMNALIKNDDQWIRYLRFLDTGDSRHLADKLFDEMLAGGGDRLYYLSNELKRLPSGQSLHTRYPIKEAFAKLFVNEHFPMSRTAAAEILPKLYKFMTQHSDYKEYFAGTSKMSSDSLRYVHRAHTKFRHLFSIMVRDTLASGGPSALNAFAAEFVPQAKKFETEKLTTMFRPMRQTLIDLISAERLVVPQLTAEEKRRLEETLEKMREQIEQQKKSEQADASIGELSKLWNVPKRVQQDRPIQVFTLQNYSAQMSENFVPVWDREVEMVDPRAFQVLIASQDRDDIISPDFQFPLILRWSDKLFENLLNETDMEWAIDDTLRVWDVDFRALLKYKHSGPVQDRLSVRNFNKKDLPQVRTGVTPFAEFGAGYRFYHMMPSYYVSGSVKNGDYAENSNLPFRFAKMTKKLAEYWVKGCAKNNVHQAKYNSKKHRHITCTLETSPGPNPKIISRWSTVVRSQSLKWLQGLFATSAPISDYSMMHGHNLIEKGTLDTNNYLRIR